MARILIILGTLLDIFAIGALIASLNNSAPTTALSQSLVCNTGETYQEELGRMVATSATGNSRGREFFAYCIGREGERRDVTPQAFMVKAGMFAVPFVLGLILFLAGIISFAQSRSRRAAQQIFEGFGLSTDPLAPQPSSGRTPLVVTKTFQTGDQGATVFINGQQATTADIPPEVSGILKQFFGDFQASAAQMQSIAGRGDLVSRLKQLQEARDANLITQEEFDRTRRQILDSMDDQ
ncbi:MAG: SHOCT domain-containing protein [Anaerolineae bacterium]|nr:SHOCT domain-containing protein [Anaerolineae bacterium]